MRELTFSIKIEKCKHSVLNHICVMYYRVSHKSRNTSQAEHIVRYISGYVCCVPLHPGNLLDFRSLCQELGRLGGQLKTCYIVGSNFVTPLLNVARGEMFLKMTKNVITDTNQIRPMRPAKVWASLQPRLIVTEGLS